MALKYHQVMDKFVKVLIVEDDPLQARLQAARLDASPTTPFQAHHVASLEHALDHLANESADAVLLDLELPDATGVTAVRAIRHAYPDIPIIVATGTLDDHIHELARQAGAADVTRKGSDSDEMLEMRILASAYRLAYARLAQADPMAPATRALMADIALHLRTGEHIVRDLRRGIASGAEIGPEFLDKELARLQEALAPMRLPADADLLLRPVALRPLLEESSADMVDLVLPGRDMIVVAQEPSLRRALAALVPMMHAVGEPIHVAWVGDKDMTVRVRFLFSGAEAAQRRHPLLWTLAKDLLALSMVTAVADVDGLELRFPAVAQHEQTA